MKSVNKKLRKMPSNKSVALRCSSVLSFVVISLLLSECSGSSMWEADQQRIIEKKPINHRIPTTFGPNHGRASYPRYPIQYQTNPSRRSFDIEDPQSPYSHANPAIVSVPESRTIYRSVEDPSALYINKNSLNVTERERNQLLSMKSRRNGYPRLGFANPKYHKKVKFHNLTPNDGDETEINISRATIANRDSRPGKKWKSSVDHITPDIQYWNSGSSLRTRSESSACVTCPSERTSVAAKGKERALLLPPGLKTCRGRPAPIDTTFVTLYGPKIGSLVKEGSHVILGNIMRGNETLRMCQYRYNVIVRRCPQPQIDEGVTATCQRKSAWGSSCRFTCTSPGQVLRGPVRATCGDDLLWTNPSPICQEPAGNWCETRPMIQYSRLTCDAPIGQAPPGTLPERTSCNVWCRGGNDRRRRRSGIPDRQLVCQRGLWRGDNSPCPKPDRQKKQRKNKRTMHQDFGNLSTEGPHQY